MKFKMRVQDVLDWLHKNDYFVHAEALKYVYEFNGQYDEYDDSRNVKVLFDGLFQNKADYVFRNLECDVVQLIQK